MAIFWRRRFRRFDARRGFVFGERGRLEGGDLDDGIDLVSGQGHAPRTCPIRAPHSDSEVSAQIKLGRAEASALRRDEAARVVAPVPSKAFTWQGKALKIPGVAWADMLRALGARPKFRVQKKAPPLKPDTSLAAPDGSVWLIPAPGFAAHPFGTEVVLACGSVVFGSHGIFAAAEGIPVELVKLAYVGRFAAAKATG